MKTRKFLLAATAAMTALLFGLTSCEDKGGNGGLTLSPNYVPLAPGESTTVTLNSDGVAVDAASVTWTSNAPEVFTIENGTITAIKVGKGTFTATYNNSSVTGDVVVSEVAPTVPTIEPVAGGVTIAAYIPEGSDCNGIQWAGENTDWKGKDSPLTKVEGSDGWYKIDFVDLTGINGKLLATPESGEGTDNNWATQMGDYEIMQESTATYEINSDGNIVASTEGIIYVWVRSWKSNPCEEDREYTFYIQVPECTPAGTTQVNVVGSFISSDGTNWATGDYFDIVNGVATVTILGQAATEWKVRLTSGAEVFIDQAVECSTSAEGVVSIAAWDNKTLGEAEGQTIEVEGWGDNGAAIEGCLTDCAVTSAQ